MNVAISLRNNTKRLKPLARIVYASTISNTQSFEEDRIRAKLKPLTGQGGKVLFSYGVKKEDIAVITFDNASRKNALTGHMMVQLAEIIDQLETWKSGKGVILRGKGGSFVSGGDLNFVKASLTQEEGTQISFFMQKTLNRLRQLPLVSLAVVEGKALGGGAELATACDLRIMSKDAEIRFIHAKLGVSTGLGGGARLVKLVGRQKALEILLQCKRMNLEESLKCGLADARLPDCKANETQRYVWENSRADLLEDILETSTDWLASYLRDHTSVTRAIKGVVAAADDLPMDEALIVERSYFSTLWGGEAHRNALNQNIKHK